MRRKALRITAAAAAFCLPALILWIVYQLTGYAPAGDKTVLIMDMRNQYAPFYAWLRSLLSGESSLFFSLQKQLGTGTAGLFAYYLASPLNGLLLLFPAKQLPLALSLLTCLKTGLCGLTMQLYLQRRRHLPALPALTLSLGYALMSYNIVYGICLMWLDTVALLPLTVWNVERLADGRRPTGLIVCLVLLFWCDYYLAYAVGLFCLLYLCVLLAVQPRALSPLRAVGRLALSAAAAFGLLAWFLLPVLLDLLSGAGQAGNWRPASPVYYAPWRLLEKLIPGYYTTITYYGLPQLYCGSITLIAALCGLADVRLPRRKRWGSGALLLILAVSFFFCPLDFIWHGFRFPNWFPARYSFLWGFVLVLTAAGWLVSLPLRAWQRQHRRLYAGVCALLLAVTVAETGKNAAAMLQGLNSEFGCAAQTEWENAYDETAALARQAQERDGDVYRVEKTYQFSQNDGMLYGYAGISHYSSTYHAPSNRLCEALGLTRRWLWISSRGATPVTDTLLGVRYVLSKSDMPAYSAVSANDTVTVFKNSCALPMLTAADKHAADWAAPDTENPFAVQESLLDALCGEETRVWRHIAVEQTVGRFTVTVPADGVLYAAFPANGGKNGSLYADGSYIARCFTQNGARVFAVGRYAAGQEVTLMLTAEQTPNAIWLAVLDEESLARASAALQGGSAPVEQQRASVFTRTVTAEEGQILYTSLPYSRGFAVYADGKRLESFAVGGGLLGAALPAGTHRITVRYTAPGLKIGLSLTAVTAAALGIILYKRRKRA